MPRPKLQYLCITAGCPDRRKVDIDSMRFVYGFQEHLTDKQRELFDTTRNNNLCAKCLAKYQQAYYAHTIKESIPRLDH